METAEKINPYKWSKENLSEARARAFERAYSELERSKFSAEWYEESKKEEALRIAFIRANLEKTNAIQDRADQEADALENQANELLKQARAIRNNAHEEVSRIQSEVYHTEEYKAQRAKVSELWNRDNDAIQPRVQALMERYLKAQEESLKA